MVAIVAEDPVLDEEGAATSRWLSHLLLVSDGFVVRVRTEMDEDELHALGAQIAEVEQGARTEIAFSTSSKTLFLSLVRRPRGDVAVAGHIVRDETGLISAFETRTDVTSLRSFGEELRAFPHG